MGKSKLLPVIAAIMITSMAVSMLSFSTTTVSASPGVSPSSVTVRGNTLVKLTFTITNDTGDNIENVRFYIYGSPTPSFSAAIGGASAAENLKLAAENLENAEDALKRAGENLKLAGDNKMDAGPEISSAASSLNDVAFQMSLLGWGAAAGKMSDAALYLGQLGDNMALETENAILENSLLYNAGIKLTQAGAGFSDGNPGGGKENIENAGIKLRAAGDALRNGSLRQAAENISAAGDNIYDAGVRQTGDNDTLATALKAAGLSLKIAENCLLDAAQYENLAGIDVVAAGEFIKGAANSVKAADTDLTQAGDNLLGVWDRLSLNAGLWLQPAYDSLFSAGANLTYAFGAGWLDNAGTLLGIALGGDELVDAAEHMDAAGDSMADNLLNLGVAGDELIEAAKDISAAATVLLATANAFGPAGWSIASDAANDVLFSADGAENHIANTLSKDFVFLWTTPNVGAIDNVYTLKIYVYKPGSSTPMDPSPYNVTLTVDGKGPSVTITVTQVGVTENNVVGNKLDNGVASVTIVADEACELGEVYVEDSITTENLLPPLSISTADNLRFTATFSVGVWDDNAMQIRVASAKDAQGNENTNMTQAFTVDTRAPIFTDNGFVGLVAGMRQDVMQAGSSMFRYVDNTGSKQIYGRAEDNVNNADNAEWCTVLVNDVLASKDAAENFFKAITLSPGLNTVIVKAVDRTGNEVSENIDNIFIDNQAPTITFNTITRKTGAVNWTANGFLTNDNKPTIKATILDPGYPTSGLGVAYRGLANPDNLFVYLDNNDNLDDGTPAAPYGQLDNKIPWIVENGVFENLIDNGGNGLADGTYWIIVRANDNLGHAGDNDKWVIAKRSFVIDTTVPTWTTAQLVATVTVKDPTTSLPLGATTKITSWLISGGARKSGSTINVYVSASAPVLIGTTTASTTLNTGTGLYDYSLTVTLPQGVGKNVYIEEVDTASNSSGQVLLGTYTVDATPPVIVLSSPAVDTTTGEAQITVSGTITDVIVTDPQTLIVTIYYTGTTGETVPLNADGSFESTVPLVEGTNIIRVTAADGPITATSGNQTTTTRTVTRSVTPLTTYAIILVVVALILAAIAIFRKEMK